MTSYFYDNLLVVEQIRKVKIYTYNIDRYSKYYNIVCNTLYVHLLDLFRKIYE